MLLSDSNGTQDTLTAADAEALIALLEAEGSIFQAARARDLAPLAFLELIRRPAAQEALARLRDLSDFRREQRAEAIREELIIILRDVARDTPDRAEKRRAASTALRATDRRSAATDHASYRHSRSSHRNPGTVGATTADPPPRDLLAERIASINEWTSQTLRGNGAPAPASPSASVGQTTLHREPPPSPPLGSEIRRGEGSVIAERSAEMPFEARRGETRGALSPTAATPPHQSVIWPPHVIPPSIVLPDVASLLAEEAAREVLDDAALDEDLDAELDDDLEGTLAIARQVLADIEMDPAAHPPEVIEAARTMIELSEAPARPP